MALSSVVSLRCACGAVLGRCGRLISRCPASAATSGHSEPAEQGELLLIHVGQAAVRQLVATGRGHV
eukprot:COSAG06_NODE_2463_length_6830_cov_17.476155_5_plen_67_part_00